MLFVLYRCTLIDKERGKKKGERKMAVTMKEYYKDMENFFKKHDSKAERTTYTSPMENNSYYKETSWENGANWYEVTALIEEMVEAEAHGIKVMVPVKMWRTEYWTTEQASKYAYSRA